MNNSFVPHSFAAHDGTFHADEVTACALLLLFDLIDKDKIYRTRDPDVLKQCEFVCDVGGVYDPQHKLFDHHQADYQGPLSSAGMIWKYLHEMQFVDEAEYHYLNDTLIVGVDDHDNGRSPLIPGLCTISHVVANFGPISYDVADKIRDQAFIEAVDFMLGHLRRLRERYRYILSCRETVAQAMQSKGYCLIFDEAIPWIESFFDLGGESHPALFIIMPAGEHWKLRAIPPSYAQRMGCRLFLPEEWAGRLEHDLQAVTGIPGSVFCHKGRFISVWETKEAALQALDHILKQAELKHENGV